LQKVRERASGFRYEGNEGEKAKSSDLCGDHGGKKGEKKRISLSPTRRKSFWITAGEDPRARPPEKKKKSGTKVQEGRSSPRDEKRGEDPPFQLSQGEEKKKKSAISFQRGGESIEKNRDSRQQD